MKMEKIPASARRELFNALVFPFAVEPFIDIMITGDKKPLYMPAIAPLVAGEHLKIQFGENFKRCHRTMANIARHHDCIDFFLVKKAQHLFKHRQFFFLAAIVYMGIRNYADLEQYLRVKLFICRWRSFCLRKNCRKSRSGSYEISTSHYDLQPNIITTIALPSIS